MVSGSGDSQVQIIVVNHRSHSVWEYSIPASQVKAFIETHSASGIWGNPGGWVHADEVSVQDFDLVVGSEELVHGGHLYKRVLLKSEFQVTVK